MTLLISEDEVQELADMNMALSAIEGVLHLHGSGDAINLPRRRLNGGHTTLQLMGGAIPSADRIGYKAYVGGGGATRFVVNLYRESTGELDAIIEAGRLGQLRTGAASGVSAKFLAREDASIVGIIGSGYQARTQLEAVAAVRTLTSTRVFSPSACNRKRFAQEMSERLSIDIDPVASGEEACAGAGLIITATNSVEPVIEGHWVAPGCHLMAMGANRLEARELDSDLLASIDLIAADDIEQAKFESGDLVSAVEMGLFAWDSVIRMGDIVAGVRPGRTSLKQRTLFKSLGIAIWDVALADMIYRAAIDAGLGTKLDMYRNL